MTKLLYRLDFQDLNVSYSYVTDSWEIARREFLYSIADRLVVMRKISKDGNHDLMYSEWIIYDKKSIGADAKIESISIYDVTKIASRAKTIKWKKEWNKYTPKTERELNELIPTSDEFLFKKIYCK